MATPSEDRPPKLVPRHAATVMLLREVRDATEVLVIRRHENLAFMGGLWVFPGGALSPADTSPAALSCIPESSQARCAQFADLHGNALDKRDCLGIVVAAYRETFEETGVLLATTAAGDQCDDDVLRRTQEQRSAIVSQPELFASLLHKERLQLDIARLTYWAHWITPSNAPRRFDTRFFIASVPREQTATIDSIEAVDHAWMSPAALVSAAQNGSMPISTPTLYNLIALDTSMRQHDSLHAMLAQASRHLIAPVLPKVIRGDKTTIVLPWDADYADIPGESAPPDIIYPQWLRALPSRMTTSTH